MTDRRHIPLNGIVTGEIGAGKTTVCETVANLARDRGLVVGGVITPAIHDQRGEKAGIAIVDLQTSERRVLGHLDHGQPGLKVGTYRFDEQALSWGCAILDRVAATGCDLFLVDEVGPLELVEGRGFARALSVLAAGSLSRTLTVVRPALLDQVRQRAPDARFAIFWVDERNREALPATIVAQLFGRRCEKAGTSGALLS